LTISSARVRSPAATSTNKRSTKGSAVGLDRLAGVPVLGSGDVGASRIAEVE
jgi:hypothetical protein